MDDVIRTRSEVQQAVRQHIADAAAYAARYANQHRRDLTFEVGSLVWLRTTNLPLPSGVSRKLTSPWTGPYEVT